MCKITNIRDYAYNYTMQQDFLEEVKHYTRKLIDDCNKLFELRKKHFCFSRKKRILELELEIEHDKNLIETFTALYQEYNIPLVRSI